VLPGQQFTPDVVLNILWRRRYAVLVPCVAVFLAGAAYISTIPDEYQSETLILVVPQRVPESYVRSTVTAPIEDRLRSIQQQIFSRSRLERVVLDFDLYKAERQREVMEDIVARMRNDVNVLIERGDAFRIRYASPDPRLAQRVTERLASMFIEENLRDREVLAEGTNQFLEAQLEDARQRLIEQEKKLEQYQRQHSGELPSQVQSNIQAIATLQIQLQGLSDSLRQDRDRRLVLERQMSDVQKADVAGDLLLGPAALQAAAAATAAAPTAAARLETATTQLRAMELRYRPGHPDILAARRLIRDRPQPIG